jgi:hypothetical protein
MPEEPETNVTPAETAEKAESSTPGQRKLVTLVKITAQTSDEEIELMTDSSSPRWT